MDKGINRIMEKILNTPELRFPEFEGEWICVKLKSLLEFKNGINASKEQYGVGVKFINVLDILSNDFITYEKISGRVNVSQDIVEKYAVRFGDILFQRSSETREEVGSASVYMDSDNVATFGGFVIRGRKIGKYDPIFLNKLLKTDIARDTITSKSGGSTRYNVSQEILSEVELTLPSLPEQQKIAQFLSSVDEKIQALKKKKSLLEQYKKGMIQKIFSQELRFKDENGNEFPEWEERKLGEVLIKYEEKTIRNNQFPILTSARTGIYFQKDYFDGNEVASKDNTGYNVVPKGFFTYRHMSDDTSFKFNINTLCEKGIVSTLYPVFTTRNMNDYFLQISLNEGPQFKNYAIMQKQGGSRTYMYFSKLEQLELPIPSLAEQTKIANFLSAIDEKIEHVGNQLAKMEQWKKGLLQKMFV